MENLSTLVRGEIMRAGSIDVCLCVSGEGYPLVKSLGSKYWSELGYSG